MIYLIESSAFKRKEDGTIEYFQLLKIGYTDDSKKDNRYSAYKLHNPTCKVIYEIPNGTEYQEHKLHYKFKDKKYKEYGDEWYNYDQDIVDYIKTVTLDELTKLPNNPKRYDSKKITKEKIEAKQIISYLFDTKEEINNYLSILINKLGDTISYTTALDYISQDSTIDQDKLKNYYDVKNRSDTGIYVEDNTINIKIIKFLKLYKSTTILYDRLKLLCNSDFSKDIIILILDQLPNSDEAKYYYTVLGEDRLKKLGYSVTLIRRELGIVTFNSKLLLDTIYSNFHVGERYLLPNLKQKISDVYASINYTMSPKAIDIMNYFKVKEIKVTTEIDSIKKRVKGYELIASREVELRAKLEVLNSDDA